MYNVQRSVSRDVKAMSKGLDYVNAEMALLDTNVKLNKAERKRLERLRTVKVQLVDQPEDCQKLVKQYKEIK